MGRKRTLARLPYEHWLLRRGPSLLALSLAEKSEHRIASETNQLRYSFFAPAAVYSCRQGRLAASTGASRPDHRALT
jgi:hypothetical protein